MRFETIIAIQTIQHLTRALIDLLENRNET